MPRDWPGPLLAVISGNAPAPCFLLDLALAGGMIHVWSGYGVLSWNGNDYSGLGDLAGVGEIQEGIAVRAEGTSVTLSGIDTALLNDCIADIQVGAAATLWLGALASGAIVAAGALFVGVVGAPAVLIGPQTIAIQLKLETKMSNLKRATNRRYTTADQRYYYSTDIGFGWVEVLNDIALQWG